MSDTFQIKNQKGIYFLTFQVVGWADFFTRRDYKDIIIESIEYCRTYKSLKIYSYVIMSNHIHCILATENNLSEIVRDFKKFTSKKILKSIEENIQEIRREWMIWMMESAGKNNSNNVDFQFWQQRRRVALIFLKGLLGNK
jgi:REP element-mobilizing transposase RayT